MYEYQYGGNNAGSSGGAYFQYDNGAYFKPKPAVSSSRIWFASLVPAIALYVELYASDLYLGIMVWACALISIWTACALDKKYLCGCGADMSTVSAADIALAPKYIYKRCKLLGQGTSPVVVMAVALLYALANNGFTDALTLDEDGMIGQIKYNYAMNISEISEYESYNMIGGALLEWSGLEDADFEWSAERKTDSVEVAAVSSDISVLFSIGYDGYAFGDITVPYLKIGSKEYSDDELIAKLAEIFVYQDSSGFSHVVGGSGQTSDSADASYTET